jgi:hypothetical protein
MPIWLLCRPVPSDARSGTPLRRGPRSQTSHRLLSVRGGDQDHGSDKGTVAADSSRIHSAISFQIEPELKAAFQSSVPDGRKRSDKLRGFVSEVVNGTGSTTMSRA